MKGIKAKDYLKDLCDVVCILVEEGDVYRFSHRSFQTYFAAKHFRNQVPLIKSKRGAIILVGGGDGNPKKAYETLCGILNHINTKEICKLVGSFNTNEIPAIEDDNVIIEIKNVVDFLNK